jgi:hypothetical protein
LDPRREALVQLFEGFEEMGFVALERRQREEGHRFWYNAYWKTKTAGAGEGGN